MGMPYITDKSVYEKLIKDNESKFEDCGRVTRQPGTTLQCSIAYTEEIQDTITNAISHSNSIHENDGSGYSESLEKVYGIINSESKTRGINIEDTRTENSEYSTSYMISEENSHMVTSIKETTDEKKNWSESVEKSHTEEVSRMSLDDFNK
eukprot:jgi/Orpsp1_1/1189837/evm.model.d7180000074851.1